MRHPTPQPPTLAETPPTSASADGRPDFTVFQDLARQNLIQMLDSVRGTKVLVLDPSLSQALSLVADLALIKEHGVEGIFYLDRQLAEKTIDGKDIGSVLYLCRPRIELMHCIADHIRDATQRHMELDYSLFFMPRRTLVCDRILEEQGVLGDLTIGEFPLDLIPLERDLASLELNDCFRTLWVDDVPTSLFSMARALMRLQAVHGFFPRIVGKGNAAKQLCDMLIRMRRELSVDEPLAAQSCTLSQTIDTLVVFDRTVDLISPLCTQLTYEGLIDELFGISCSIVKVDRHLKQSTASAAWPSTIDNATTASTSSAAPSAPVPGDKDNVCLNNQDPLFAELRDLNFSVVGRWLHRTAKRLNADYEDRHQAQTVSQLRQFIGRLGSLQAEHKALKLHTYLAEVIYKHTLSAGFNRALELEQALVGGSTMSNSSPLTAYVEELIGRQAPLTYVLRLLCLQSLVSGGLKPKLYEYWWREIVQTYGYAHIMTLERLARLKLLYPLVGSTRHHYASVRKLLRLVVDEVDEVNPDDISFVYSGFAPILVRLVQCVIRDPTVAGSHRPGLSASSTSRFGAGAGLDMAATWSSLTGPIAQALGADHSAGPTAGSAIPDSVGRETYVPVVQTTGWKDYEDIIHLLPGQAFDCVQTVEDANAYTMQNWRHTKDRPTTVVFFVGGCTYAEIAAIRFLSQQNNRDFLIATTHIISGNSLIDSVMDATP